MGRQPLGSENIRKINRLAGKSYTITLPIRLVRELGWQEHQKVTVRKKGKTLLIEDWE